jgi:hypothetical protein
MYVCMYVCMYVSMYVCMYTSDYTQTVALCLLRKCKNPPPHLPTSATVQLYALERHTARADVINTDGTI